MESIFDLIDEKELVDIFSKAVDIPSTNPKGNEKPVEDGGDGRTAQSTRQFAASGGGDCAVEGLGGTRHQYF